MINWFVTKNFVAQEGLYVHFQNLRTYLFSLTIMNWASRGPPHSRYEKSIIYLTKLEEDKAMTTKKNTWDIILKVIIAVASAIAGALGANAMNL